MVSSVLRRLTSVSQVVSVWAVLLLVAATRAEGWGEEGGNQSDCLFVMFGIINYGNTGNCSCQSVTTHCTARPQRSRHISHRLEYMLGSKCEYLILNNILSIFENLSTSH